MAKFLVLSDFEDGRRRFGAGKVVDSDHYDLDALQAAGLVITPYDEDSMAPLVRVLRGHGKRATRGISPPILAALLQSRGKFPADMELGGTVHDADFAAELNVINLWDGAGATVATLPVGKNGDRLAFLSDSDGPGGHLEVQASGGQVIEQDGTLGGNPNRLVFPDQYSQARYVELLFADRGGDPAWLVRHLQPGGGSASSSVDWQESVLAQQNDPPGAPNDGDRYVVGTVPTGAWLGHANEIARWNDGGAQWDFTVPNPGFATYNEGTGQVLIFNGAAWAPLATTDPDAIHDNEAGEIAAVAEKAAPVAADLALIEDSAAGDAKKRVQLGNLPAPTAAVAKALFDANTLLKADVDDTPTALPVAAKTLVGRSATGSIGALNSRDARQVLEDPTRAATVSIAGGDRTLETWGVGAYDLLWFIDAAVTGSAANIHGVAGDSFTHTTKRIVRVQTGSAFPIVWKHESGTEAVASNRIRTPGGIDFVQWPGDVVELVGDPNSSRWVLVALTSANDAKPWVAEVTGAGPHALLSRRNNRYNDSGGAGMVLHLPVAKVDGEEIELSETGASANNVTLTTAAGTTNIIDPATGATATSVTLATAGGWLKYKWDATASIWRVAGAARF